MSCVRKELRIVRGTSQTYRITVADEASNEINLTGATAHFRIKLTINASTPELSLSSAVPADVLILTQSGSTLGQFDVFLDPTDTASLPIGKHVYDAWVVLASGERHAVIEPALFYIERGVTELA